MPQDLKLSRAAQEQLGLWPGSKFYSPSPLAGMNTQSSPVAIADQEFVYIENFFRLGDGKMRSAWDVGAPIYRAPVGLNIVFVFFFNISSTYYAAVFLSDGSAVQVNVATQATTSMGPPGTFYSADNGQLPCCAQYGALFLLIANRNTTNDYWAWDGAILYGAGSSSPNGALLTGSGNNYNTAPLVTPYGGEGSGLAVTPLIQAGGVVNLQTTNPGTGYQIGDIVQLQFAGGGSDTGAILTAVMQSTPVGAVRVTAGGSGYIQATTSVAITGGGGAGATASVTVTNGAVTDIVITSGGSGYTSPPAVVITGAGSGASAQSLLSPTQVASVTVTNPGTNYNFPPAITFSGGGGAGATGHVLLTGTSIARVEVVAGGSGYKAAPTVTAVSAGGGTGATFTATVEGGQVTSITVTAGGSGYDGNVEILITPASSDPGVGAAAVAFFTPTTLASVVLSNVGFGYTSTPAVVITPGANNAAAGQVLLMPFGVSGATLETYLSRVWLANPKGQPYATFPSSGDWLVSAPGSIVDFATADGGLTFVSSDGFLQTKYVAIRQNKGYIYFYGDGSVSVGSNVQTGGNPPTTVINYQNVNPQKGVAWRDSIQDFGETTLFANPTGVYGVYGGAVTKVSSKMDDFFLTMKQPAAGGIVPSGAIATVFNIQHYLFLATFTDPDSGVSRNVMATWNEREWSVTSQSVTLTFIANQKVESVYNPWGTDGLALYPLFNTPSQNLVKRLDTKLYGNDSQFIIKSLVAVYVSAQDNSQNKSGITGTISVVASGIQPQNEEFGTVGGGVSSPILQPLSMASPPPQWSTWGAGNEGVPFVNIGLRISSTSPDFTVANLAIAYFDNTAMV